MKGSQRVFTDEEMQYIKDNYNRITQVQIAKHLGVSAPLINKTLKLLGIYKPKSGKGQDMKDSTKMCMDCVNYIPGGKCMKYGSTTGALQSKSCFKS